MLPFSGDSVRIVPLPSHAMIPFAFPLFSDKRLHSRQYHRRANRLALGLFTLTTLVGLAIKYLV